jgi:hypothetical protein
MQELQVLPPQEAYVKLHTAPPVRIKTLAVHDAHSPHKELQAVLDTYKRRYQRTRAEAEVQVVIPGGDHIPAKPSTVPFELFSDRRARG